MRIGVFDSGIGGITVLSELKRSLRGADFVYLGDTANVPYGTKSPEQVRRLSRECARILKKKRVDAVVVACNTASSLALDAIRAVMGRVPVFGVVEPGVQSVLQALEERRALVPRERARPKLLVLATRATVRSGAYGRELRRLARGHAIAEQPCPLLVPMIEEGWVDHPVLHRTIREYVEAHRKGSAPGVALLACTHYPWIHAAFEKALPGWRVINSAQAVARSLASSEFWRKRELARRRARAARIEWIFTDPHCVPKFAFRLSKEKP